MSTRFHHLLVAFFAAVALGTAGYVIADLNTYMSDSGAVGVVPDRWPDRWPVDLAAEASGALAPSDGGWTFVLTAHPGCPCTRATADQLIRALDGADPADRLIVLVRTDAEPIHAGLDLGVLAPLGRLPIARFVPDPDATLSAAFGGLTSGFLVVFDPEGRTVFAGGLTPRRGMVGPAAGVEALRDLIGSESPTVERAEVFGCPLCDDPEKSAFEQE